MKILFLTTANLCQKPRLVKEIQVAKNMNLSIKLYSFRFRNWTDEIHRQLVNELRIENYEIDASKARVVHWLVSSLINKIAIWMWPIFNNNLPLAAFAGNKRSVLLYYHLLKEKGEFSFINGRNNATLYPLWYLHRKFSVPFVFDVEDYHPGESLPFDQTNEQLRRKYLFRKILPHASFVTYASDLIGLYTLDVVEHEKIGKHFLVRNSFPKHEFSKITIDPGFTTSKVSLVKLVWFSQQIDRGRGLELILSVLDKYENKCELHLIGNAVKEFQEKYLSERKYVHMCGTLTQADLHQLLGNFDIGLALEPGKDLNNNLAISNKIFAYAQSGLFILATDTQGQQQFIEQHPWVGISVERTQESVDSSLQYIISNIDEIRKNKVSRFQNATKLGWETEGEKLSKAWSTILADS